MTQPPIDSQAGVSQTHAQAVVALCARVLPVWARQLMSSRSQSEQAVAEMLSAFAEIGPHLDRASRQSHQITEALAAGSGGIMPLAQACQAVVEPVLAQCPPSAQEAWVQVLRLIQSTVAALEQIAKPFEYETRVVSQQVERMYKGFQYQDRISQMMTLLHDDMVRLIEALGQADAAALDADAWLARLQSQYVMAEQHRQHTEGTAAAESATDDTTFF
ncbi:MAG: hypothetical protein OHK0048_26760 [Rhodoferax sp.]